jgi:tetratricopeptide (TPR) repeat protein
MKVGGNSYSMNSFKDLIKNHDLENIKNFSLSKSPNIEELFFFVEALLITGDTEKARDTLNDNKTFFEEHDVSDILIHRLKHDLGKPSHEFFMMALRKDYSYKKNTKIYGLYNFSIGFYFLREKKFELAIKYYRESLACFERELLDTWSWRSSFNIFICNQYIHQFSTFEKDFEELNESFQYLPVTAKRYFSRFMTWLYLFMGKVDEASLMCEEQIVNNKKDEANVSNYLFYINLLFDPERKSIKVCKRTAFVEHLEYIHTHDIDIVEFESRATCFKISHRFMLAHAFLQKKYINEKFYEIIQLFDQLSCFLTLDDTVVIPPYNLYDYLLLSCTHTQEMTMRDEVLYDIKKRFPQWGYDNSVKKISDLDRKINETVLYFDVEKRLLTHKELEFDTHNMFKMHQLLLVLCKGRKRYNLKEVANDIYGIDKSDNNVDKLKSLAFRLKKLLLLNFYEIKKNSLLLSGSYRFVQVAKKGRKIDFHPGMITDLLSESPGHTMTTNQIKESLKASSRTVTNNLRILIEDKRVLRLGNARSCRYQLIKK